MHKKGSYQISSIPGTVHRRWWYREQDANWYVHLRQQMGKTYLCVQVCTCDSMHVCACVLKDITRQIERVQCSRAAVLLYNFLSHLCSKDEQSPRTDFLSWAWGWGGAQAQPPWRSGSQALEFLMLSKHHLPCPTWPGWGLPVRSWRQIKLAPRSFAGFVRAG